MLPFIRLATLDTFPQGGRQGTIVPAELSDLPYFKGGAGFSCGGRQGIIARVGLFVAIPSSAE